MTTFSYSNLNTPYPKMTFQNRTKKLEQPETSENEKPTDSVDSSKGNQTVTKSSTLEHKINELEIQLRSKLELFKKIANAFGDEIDVSGTINKSGWVQKTTHNRTQDLIEEITALLDETVTEKTVEKLEERVENLQNALEKINIEIDHSYKQNKQVFLELMNSDPGTKRFSFSNRKS